MVEPSSYSTDVGECLSVKTVVSRCVFFDAALPLSFHASPVYTRAYVHTTNQNATPSVIALSIMPDILPHSIFDKVSFTHIN